MNSTLNKLSWGLAIVILMIALVSLILAVTDVWPGNPLQEHRLVVAMGFITVGGAVRNAYVRSEERKVR